MEVITIYSSLSIFILVVAFKFFRTTGSRHKNFPPGPPALPIIGHLHLLKEPLHRTLQTISEKYGPIFSLRFGSRFVLVVSSSCGVEECLNQKDIIFANRPRMIFGKYHGYNSTIIGLAPYGEHLRNLRRLCSREIFSSYRLQKTLEIRRDEVKMLLNKLYKVSRNEFAQVHLKSMITELTFNVIFIMVVGKRLYGEDSSGVKETQKFREIIEETFELAGAAFPGDYIPILKWVDFTGNLKKMKRVGKEIDVFLQSLVDEQRRNKKSDSMINYLLSLQQSEPEYYTDDIIKGLVEIMIMAGTDTSEATIEWAMSNLLNHPDILQKAREEIDSQVGYQLIDEQDISKLPYLQNIISETFRLYAPAPLLVPHRSSSDCIIGGYDIPRDATLLINAWAIQRDPKYWDDATSFKPERFGPSQGEGGTYKLLPFGIGRRACPGIPLANRVVGLALGSLIQCFEWERVNSKKIDMG
ncbi:hypothetical protein ACFE04_022598 [Oxalis oulophora]